MSQSTPIIGADKSGLQYRTEDNDGKQSLLNHHKGSTAPSYAEVGCLWLDDSATPWLLKWFDGTDWIVQAGLDATLNQYTSYHAGVALGDATDTAKGIVERATDAEVTTGTDTTRYITPKQLADNSGGGFTLLATATASSSTVIDFTQLSSDYDNYLIKASGVTMSADDAALHLRMSTDGGTNFISSSTYSDTGEYYVYNNATLSHLGSAAIDRIRITNNLTGWKIGNASGEGYGADITVFDVNSTSRVKFVQLECFYLNSLTKLITGHGGGVVNPSAVVDALRITAETGNILTGEFSLFGMAKS